MALRAIRMHPAEFSLAGSWSHKLRKRYFKEESNQLFHGTREIRDFDRQSHGVVQPGVGLEGDNAPVPYVSGGPNKQNF